MSSLKNWVYSPAPKVPELLKGKLEFVANYPISESEAQEFGIALNAISEELMDDGISTTELTRVTGVFTENGSFEFENSGEDISLGLHFSLAVYAIERIREKREEVGEQGQIVSFIVYIEELVHHFWRLEDEVETKVKLAKIISRIYGQNIKVTDLFPREWLNAELQRQGKEPKY